MIRNGQNRINLKITKFLQQNIIYLLFYLYDFFYNLKKHQTYFI